MVRVVMNVGAPEVELSAELNSRHWVVVLTHAMYMTSREPCPGTRIRCPPGLVKVMMFPFAVAQLASWSMLSRSIVAPSQALLTMSNRLMPNSSVYQVGPLPTIVTGQSQEFLSMG